jgi:hypothetical protein
VSYNGRRKQNPKWFVSTMSACTHQSTSVSSNSSSLLNLCRGTLFTIILATKILIGRRSFLKKLKHLYYWRAISLARLFKSGSFSLVAFRLKNWPSLSSISLVSCSTAFSHNHWLWVLISQSLISVWTPLSITGVATSRSTSQLKSLIN